MSTNGKETTTIPKKKVYTILGIAAVLIVVMIVIMLFENKKGSYKITNNSSYRLESITTCFVYDDDINGSQSTEVVDFGSLDRKKSISKPHDTIELYNLGATLEIRFKFEGMEELFVNAGYFYDNLHGDVKITFEDDGENIILKAKAKNGILKTASIDCDDVFTIHTSEGYVE